MLYSLEFFRQTENFRPSTDRNLFFRYLEHLEKHPRITKGIKTVFDKYRREVDILSDRNVFVSRIYEAAAFRQDDPFYPVLRNKNLLIFPAFYFLQFVNVMTKINRGDSETIQLVSPKLTLDNFIVSPRSLSSVKTQTLFDYHAEICLKISKTITTETDTSFYFEFSKFFNLPYPIKPIDEKDWRTKVRKAMIETVVQRFKDKLPGDNPLRLLEVIKKYFEELND